MCRAPVRAMTAATAYKVYKLYKHMDMGQAHILGIGFVVAFIVSIFAIKLFIGIVSRHGFKGFGYYRVFFGLLLLALIYTGNL